MMSFSTTSFLLVEDNDLDVEKIRRGFSRLNFSNSIVHAKDGLEALEILRGTSEKVQISRPLLVLLDLNMPRMNGIEFLEELRADPALSSTSVFVMTTSDHDGDIAAAHKYNVAGYIVKPVGREQMTEALSTLNMYWKLCKYPKNT